MQPQPQSPWRALARQAAHELLAAGEPCTPQAVAARLAESGAWGELAPDDHDLSRVALVRDELEHWLDERGDRVLVATLLTIDGQRVPVYRRRAAEAPARRRRHHTLAWWHRELLAWAELLLADAGPDVAAIVASAAQAVEQLQARRKAGPS